jgi:hypothetical protein
MVKQRDQNNQWKPAGAPPPIDESWWEAVLTEESGETSHFNIPKQIQVTTTQAPLAFQPEETLDWQYAF